MPQKNPLGYLFDIVELFVPQDLQNAPAGKWLSLKNAEGALLILRTPATGSAPTVTILQASDNAGAGSKALNITEFWSKQATTDLSATVAWTETTQAAGNTMTRTGATQDRMWATWIDAATLDVANKFNHISVTIAAPGGAAMVSSCDLILMVKYPNEPENVLTPFS